MRALVMMACEALTMTRAQFFAMHRDEQTEWLAHMRNRVTGAYTAPPK